MEKNIFIGVDGGATKCIVRVENAQGQLLGQQLSGPANIRNSPQQAWSSINLALEKILSPLGLTNDQYHLHAVMGLAGSEIPAACEEFLSQPHNFKNLNITSDSHIACLGAHKGDDGAIIIIGTGVVGLQMENKKLSRVGGWGFPQDDEGGGAWMGLEAIKFALKSVDRRIPSSALTEKVLERFHHDVHQLIAWASKASSNMIAELAPIVVELFAAGDIYANLIFSKAIEAINSLAEALNKYTNNILPCSLVGSLAPFMEPLLDPVLRSRIRPLLASPQEGAIFLAREMEAIL